MQRPDVSDKEIIELILDGWSGVSIARRYGFTDSTVIHRVKRSTGMSPSELRRQNGWAGRNIPPAEVERIHVLFGDEPRDQPGARPTVSQVARQTGHSPTTISNILKEAEVTVGGPGYRSFFSEQLKEQIKTEYADGASCPKLAEKYGVNEITIRRALRSMGVPRRPRGRPPRKQRETPDTPA